MATAAQIVAQAQAWVGCKESDGSHRKIIDVYNGHAPLARGYKVKYTDAWCSTFVSAVAIRCGATDIIPTECSCQKHIELFKALGIWYENENMTPKVGDLVLYDWGDSGSGDNRGAADHIGIVESVSGSTFRVIEGNYGNAVKRRTMSVNGRYLRGFARPSYGGAAPVTADIESLARRVIAGEFGTGADRKAALGANYEAVQNRVNEMLGSGTTYVPDASDEPTEKLEDDGEWGVLTTMALQRRLGTTVDGIISNQHACYRAANPGLLASSWEWESNPGKNGSEVIRALQRHIGAKVDGYAGPDTFRHLQRYLGTTVDGCVSNPSQMVKVMQRKLNAGTF